MLKQKFKSISGQKTIRIRCDKVTSKKSCSSYDQLIREKTQL